jgi:hypothetical protein
MLPMADEIVSYFGKLFKYEPLPKHGYVELDPHRSGFGVELNREVLTMRCPYPREKSGGLLNSSTAAGGCSPIVNTFIFKRLIYASQNH